MRRSLTLLVTLVFLFSLAAMAATAAANQNYNVEVYVNETKVRFPDQRPFIDTKAGRTYVPLRFVAEALGADVSWDGTKMTAVVKRYGHTITMPVGSARPTVNGHPRLLDAPAQLVNQRTMVPLRFVSEALGATVKWVPPAGGASGRVLITDPTAPSPPPAGVQEFRAEGNMADRYPEMAERFAIARNSKYMRITLDDLPVRVGNSIVYDITREEKPQAVNDYYPFWIDQEHYQGGKVIVYWPQTGSTDMAASQSLGLAGTPRFNQRYWVRTGAVPGADEIWVFNNGPSGYEILILPNIFKD